MTTTRNKYKKVFAKDYVDLEEELNFTLEEDVEYQIDIRNRALICAEDLKPSQGGFPVCNERFGYTHKGGKLWLRTLSFEPNEINIFKNSVTETTQSEND